MHTLYNPNLSTDSNIVEFTEGDSYHIKALRIGIGEKALISNGAGLSVTSELRSIGKRAYTFSILEFHHNLNENKYPLGLAIAILDSRERFEIALEKAVELGISDFYPLITEYTQKRDVNAHRLYEKAIAAMKQCGRSRLPSIHEPVKLKAFKPIYEEWNKVIMADIDGMEPTFFEPQSSLLIVGPEGGFSRKDLEIVNTYNGLEKWSLASRVLRSETAATIGLTLLTHFSRT